MNDKAIIIATGHSVNTEWYDSFLSANAIIYAVNGAGYYFPDSNVWFTLDTIDLAARIPKNFKGELVAAVPENYSSPDAPCVDDRAQRVEGVTYILRAPNNGQPEWKDGVVNTGCSGYGALQLAIQRGANEILLFGFDHSHEDTHFYDNAPVHAPSKVWREALNLFNALILPDDVCVWNVSPNSNITSLPKIDGHRAGEIIQRWK